MTRFKVKRKDVHPKKPVIKSRAIEEVDVWDGAASNYDDTEAYCAACLIDVNGAAGNDTKKQSHCMLPVKMPGSSSMADKGIIAAAGGRGITAVKKPSDVDQADWDAAVKKAASTIVAAYGQMDREVPESVMELSGKKRSLMLDQISMQLNQWTYEEEGRPYLASFYMERGTLYGLFNRGGELFRAPITVSTDGTTVEVGTLQTVKHEFVPVSRSSFTVKRQADGRVRFFMIAGTSIINRVGEIDSTALYDDMIQRADSTGFYPALDYWHLGGRDSRYEFGQFDFLARNGIVYIGSGLLDDSPIAAAAVRTLESDQASKWGASVEYLLPLDEGVEFVDLGEIRIPVLTRGLCTRISLLPEAAAASWSTSVEVRGVDMKATSQRIPDAKLKALRELFGEGSEEEFQEFVRSSDEINEDADKRKLIFRSTDAKSTVAPTDEAKAESDGEAEEEGESQLSVNLDEAAVEVITRSIFGLLEPSLGTVTTTLRDITAQLQVLEGMTAEFKRSMEQVNARLEELEQEEDVKHRQWSQDLPTKRVKQLTVTHRPSKERAAEPVQEDKPQDFSSIAARTLSTIKKPI